MMAGEITMRIEGVAKMIENLKRYQALKKEACRKALLKGGFKVETLAKQIITSNESVITGRLRASISTNWSGSGLAEGKTDSKAKSGDGIKEPPGEKGMVVATGTNVIYSRRVEHGFVGKDSLGRNYNQQGKPYLYPAYFSYEGEIIQDIENILKKDEGLK
jgi:hypothetical protein